MTDDDLVLLGGTVNALVVKTRGRGFPGLVVQGDTLRSLLSLVEELQQELNDKGKAEELCSEMVGILRGFFSVYEGVLEEKGFILPYARPVVKDS